MTFSRRDLLKATASAGLGAAAMPGLGRLAFAADGAPRGLLVIVHLRGGCDGLNLVSPANDPDFVEARLSDLRVADDGQAAGHRLANGPDPKIDFRLHPAAKRLGELYDAGHLAFIHAAGLTNGTRSHFEAIDMIERGIADGADFGRVGDGWLTRQLALLRPGAGVAAISATGAVSGELLGYPGALSVVDLSGGFAAPGGAQAAAVLDRLYRGGQGDVAEAGRGALAAMRGIDERLARDPAGKVRAYEPVQGVSYDSAADFARPLKVVAQLAKLEVGLEVATVDLGGWDTHEYQPGRFRTLVERLSNGLASFYADMAPFHDRLVVLVMSEFGRRLRSNRSNGTDHGRGNVMAVLGGKVAGGRFHGAWPGLAAAQLDRGVDLAVATDYRRVVTEILAATSGGRVAPDLFPGYADPGPLGIMRRA